MCTGKVRVPAREEEIEWVVNAPAATESVTRHVVKVLRPRIRRADGKSAAVALVDGHLKRVIARVQAVHPAGDRLEVLNWAPLIDGCAVLSERQVGVVYRGILIVFGLQVRA